MDDKTEVKVSAAEFRSRGLFTGRGVLIQSTARVVGSVSQEYFNTEGFNRWNRIYSDSDDVNKVQADIR